MSAARESKGIREPEPPTAARDAPFEQPGVRSGVGPIEMGVMLIAGDGAEARALADELRERLAPAHVVHVTGVRTALSVGVGGMDCIVLDVESLRDQSGIDAVRHVRSGVSDYVPLLVLLGSDDETTGAAAMSFGAQGYLAKPAMQPGQLVRTIGAIVRRQQAEMAEHELSVAQ